MLDNIEQFVDDALALSELNGEDWLADLARSAYTKGKLLVVDKSNPNIDPQVIIKDPATHRWLSVSLDSDPEDIQSVIDHFDSQYAQLQPMIDEPMGPDYNHEEDEFESLATRIVDVLLEGEMDDFIDSFDAEQAKSGGTPVQPQPLGKKIVRAVRLDNGYRLYVWRDTKRREYYGTGLGSFYLGYRFVAPDGTIIFDGDGMHPGGGWNGRITNDIILLLLQSLSLGDDTLDEEDIEKMTPAQKAWIDSDARADLENDVGGYDRIPRGFRLPWTDLRSEKPAPANVVRAA